MKTNTSNLLISVLLMIAMLLGVLAITPLTVFAVSSTPTPEETPAETVYVGGVALNVGQYVTKGSTTVVEGEPNVESGYAYYLSGGTLILSDYEYEGTGYTHDTSEKSVVYSEGKLDVILFGKNTIMNTADAIWTANGIRTKGNLTFNGPGAITINAPYAICGVALVRIDYGKIVIPDSTIAIEAGGNFVLAHGVLQLNSSQPILSGANFISGGSFTATATQGVFQKAPTISVDTENEYYMYVSYNVDGSVQEAYASENITQYKYFRLTPPAKTEINSISVSDVVIPEVGDVIGAFDCSSATYGGNYYEDGWSIEAFVGEEWQIIEDDTTVVEAGVQYRAILWIEPNEGYTFPLDITGEVLLNGQAATVHKIYEYPDYNSVEIAYEFSYTATTTSITSISVSGADLPEVGETAADMAFTPDSLTYGGAYKMVGRGFQKYTGTEWVDYNSDGDVLEYGVKYRVSLVLAPNEGYVFADSITSSDVTFNGKAGAFDTLIAGVGYASIYYEFSYEAPATDYGITIADKDGSATVGVDITSENCADVLGDGTVTYDPATNTLALNGYQYEGEGIVETGYLAITADIPTEGLTIVLVGENSITVSGSESAGMAFFGEGDLTVKGNGSLSINTIMYGITLQSDSGKLTIENAKLNITTTGAMAIGIQTTDFVMTSGDVKITASMIGIGTSNENGICLNGGSVEIGSALGGYAFIYLDFEHFTFNPIKPDLSGYVGAYKMTAGVNADGSDAGEFNEGFLNSYKYVNITEIESYGITIADKDELGATVGVLITEENYTDVLGDGTVTYDPATHTLTLNGYQYEGSGFGSAYSKYVIYVPDSIDELIIVLEGENRIGLSTESDRVWACAIYISDTDVVVKGNGSLVMNSAIVGFSNIDGESDSSLEIKGGNITVNALKSIGAKYFKMSGGSLIINAIGEDVPAGFYSYEFKMTGGNLKITSDGIGIEMWHESDEDAPPTISGGTFEISTKIAGGAFCYYNYDEDVCVALTPDLTNYVGAYKMTAGANADGTSAVDYSASDIATYKYAKLESVHVHDYGTAWESDANEHWNECECGDKANVAPHADENNDGKCDICDYAMGNADNPGGEIESEKTGLSGGAIAGIAVGSVAVAGLGGFSLFWFVIKKKKLVDLIAVLRKK